MNSQDWNDQEIIRMSGIYWRTCVLHAGVKLDIFSAISDKRLTAGEISGRIKGDERGVGMLLNALTALKLLEKTGSHYANTDAGKRWLTRDSSDYLGYIIMHHHHLMESWSHLPDAVLTGKPNRTRSSFGNEERRESFLMGMYNLASRIAPGIVAAIDLEGRKRLLDLGGGPGTYAIYFCLKNPDLTATVYDMPTTRPFAEKTITSFGLSKCISFMEGDYLTDDIRGTYDVALLSHILHGEGLDDCRMIIGKAASSLEPGGIIIIHEFILDNSMDSPLQPALFSLNMLLGTEGGQSYSEGQISEMLKDAGIGNIRRLAYNPPGESGIIIGTL
jgi:hypothetical protein